MFQGSLWIRILFEKRGSGRSGTAEMLKNHYKVRKEIYEGREKRRSSS